MHSFFCVSSKDGKCRTPSIVCSEERTSRMTTGGNTSNLFKHLSLSHPDLFRELRDRQVRASFINSDFIFTFIYNWSMHIHVIGYSNNKGSNVHVISKNIKFWSCNICTCISYNQILIEFKLSNSFAILILVSIIWRECFFRATDH